MTSASPPLCAASAGAADMTRGATSRGTDRIRRGRRRNSRCAAVVNVQGDETLIERKRLDGGHRTGL
jgi:CMP-2-keto-3-deoxyoctulosonic acid synthetase